MNREELATKAGRAREETCVFQVAVDGELHSMCRVNATGLRDRWYARWREEHGS
jgi:ribosome modulation factor